MQPLVSVIVPIYNVEKYLQRCLDSLCKQSLQDIEILLIDDASPDKCGEICDAYAKSDFRFRVFHNKKNHIHIYMQLKHNHQYNYHFQYLSFFEYLSNYLSNLL